MSTWPLRVCWLAGQVIQSQLLKNSTTAAGSILRRPPIIKLLRRVPRTPNLIHRFTVVLLTLQYVASELMVYSWH